MLHSAWALVVGMGVVIYAHERYHLVLWVVLFLLLTWASTLFFGRGAATAHENATGEAPPTLAHEVTSYLTRIMYQETLFFLLPFYAYSTVIGSPNVVFMILLGALAFFSCIDLLFDRLLRTRPLFSLSFFALVSFAALNLLLPLLFQLPPRLATPIAALLAVGGAIPLAVRTVPGERRPTGGLVLAALVLVGMAVGVPALVPPVPLRLERATFATDIDRDSLTLTDTLRSPASATLIGISLWCWWRSSHPLPCPRT